MSNLATQLTLDGLSEMVNRAALTAKTPATLTRATNRIEEVHNLLSALPTFDDLSFLHSGLCQTCLPHAKPKANHDYWRRESGRFTLLVTPGVIDDRPSGGKRAKSSGDDDANGAYVGVPFGPKARLIMIHLQTEGLKSRTVPLGASLSAFLRSLGLGISGGPRGTITAVREQCLRIARCQFTLQWSDTTESGQEKMTISDTKIVDGLDIMNKGRDDWSGTVELSQKFHEHLKDHAVPLDKRGIALLSGNSLGLDLYALFAYRLPRLKSDVHLRWEHLQGQLGSESPAHRVAQLVRSTIPSVLDAYPHANIEITRSGLTMRPSKPVVPRTMVQGFRVTDETITL